MYYDEVNGVCGPTAIETVAPDYHFYEGWNAEGGSFLVSTCLAYSKTKYPCGRSSEKS